MTSVMMVLLLLSAGSDFHPVKLTPYRAGDALTYYSYHIHGYFLSSNANQTANAKTLRQSFIDKFGVGQCGGDCAVWCPSICHWDMNMGPAGPHPVASFGFYVPLDRMLDALAFISMNHVRAKHSSGSSSSSTLSRCKECEYCDEY